MPIPGDPCARQMVTGFSPVSREQGRDDERTDRDDDVGAVSIPCDDFESFDGLYVPDNVVEGPRAVLRGVAWRGGRVG